MPKDTATTISSWDPANKPVQGFVAPGDYTNSDTSLILAGPPRIDGVSGLDLNLAQGATSLSVPGTDNVFYPIGSVQEFVKSEGRAPMMITEIGSSNVQIIPTKATGTLRLQKILLDAPSFLRALMAVYGSTGTGGSNFEALMKVYDPAQTTVNVSGSPGDNEYFLTLFSDLYNFPFGLLMLLANQKKEIKSGLYFEECYITSHNMGISTASNIIGETCIVAYSRSIPAKLLKS